MKKKLIEKRQTTVYKWCDSIFSILGNRLEKFDPAEWCRTHIKFLRGGDIFKIEDVEYLAVADSYWNDQLQCYDIKMVHNN
jgi:hypothetical protein